MDSGIKQRLIGAAVLVALAVIFLPMLVQGPAPDSGVSDVPLSMPEAPAGDFETRDLPLLTPGAMPDGGAVGMSPAAATPLPGGGAAVPPIPPAAAAPSAAGAIAPGSGQAPAVPPLPQPAAEAGAMFPAPTAAGDYAVHVGSFSSQVGADQEIAALRAAQLPGYREPGLVDGKPVWRVRIGPYASRADAEAARLRASQVRAMAGARVVALDATPATTSATTTATAPAPMQAPAAAAVAARPAAGAAAPGIGFAVQLAAFSKPAAAQALRDKVRAAGFSAFTEAVSTDKGTLTRVRIGPVVSRAEADALQVQVQAKVGIGGVVRPYP